MSQWFFEPLINVEKPEVLHVHVLMQAQVYHHHEDIFLPNLLVEPSQVPTHKEPWQLSRVPRTTIIFITRILFFLSKPADNLRQQYLL